MHFIENDPALRHVDPNDCAEVTSFQHDDEAQDACGLLRSNGIPCELSSTVLPGLPADIIPWTHKRDAPKASALLEDTEREAGTMDDDAD